LNVLITVAAIPEKLTSFICSFSKELISSLFKTEKTSAKIKQSKQRILKFF
jgi:hypothetical protein